MTYEVYRYIFIGGAILAAIMFIISVILFFVLKIPSVIGDLTGTTRRKAIEDMRNQNEETGEKTYRSSPVNIQRGKLTDKISESGSLIKHPSGSIWGAMATEKISTQKLAQDEVNETTVLGSNETTVLGSGNETTVLGSNETTVLGGFNETTVLNAGMNETSVLDSMPGMSETTLLSPSMMATGIFEIEYEITYIHTEEIIAS